MEITEPSPVEHREIKVGKGVVGRQDEGDAGSRGNRMRPLNVEAGLRIPATGSAATGRARGVVDRKVAAWVQLRKTVDLGEEVGIVRNGVGTVGINDDHGLAGTIKFLLVQGSEAVGLVHLRCGVSTVGEIGWSVVDIGAVAGAGIDGVGAMATGKEIACLGAAQAVRIEELLGRPDVGKRKHGHGKTGVGVHGTSRIVLVFQIGETLDGIDQLTRGAGNDRLRGGEAMNFSVQGHAVELHAGRALHVRHGPASRHVVIELVGGDHLQVMRRQMLADDGQFSGAGGEPGFVFTQRKPVMVVGRIPVVHLADQLVETGFVVLVEPECNRNLPGLIFGAKDLSIR